MRKQLGKFIEFSKGILPHEIEFLLEVNQLQDPDRLAILKRLQANVSQIPPGEDYDSGIDKRTYSHLKNWILKHLREADVDVFYSWVSETDMKIVNDSISPEDERQLLKLLDRYEHPGFYFTKLFEVLQNYSNFLLIRLRYKDHDRVNDFLQSHRKSYLRHKEIQEKLQAASAVIVKEYNTTSEEGLAWRGWLTELFGDPSVQGYFRYQGLIRLHYLDLRNDDDSDLLSMYDVIGDYFARGTFYSKRLLINYYHNMMLLRHKSRDFEEAVRFGYLATRVKTHDYLLYINNLCDVLVHQKRYAEGLTLLRGAAKDARNTNNYFNRVGFVAFYMRCMIGVGDAQGAASLGGSFLAAYQKEIMKFRWYRFFSNFLEALLRKRAYGELVRLVRKNKLLEKEMEMKDRPDFVPRLRLIHAMASYQMGEVDREQFAVVLEGLDEETSRGLMDGNVDALNGLG